MPQSVRPPHRPNSQRVWWCAALLLVSVTARLLWAFLTPNGLNLVDLHVYVEGAASLLQGDLYDFTYSQDTPDFPLPFTYPPFAAMVFFPLHYLPFGFVGLVWQLLTVAALYGIVRIALELLFGVDAHTTRWTSVALAWTAIGVWTEPVRMTLDYGQVNVFLVLGIMIAARSSRWWLSGGLVGILAGIKLTPAIAGLYFLARRRWSAAVFSAVVFFATVAVSVLVLGEQARRYFTTFFGDADRVGPVGSVWNQSLRGALSRIVGHDVGTGPLWLIAVVLSAALAYAAWRALGPDDRLGTLVVVQLFGLLVSPISWAHHWVWVVPMLVWLVYGPLAQRRGTRVIAACWAITTLVGVPWLLGWAQDSIWEISRPAVLSWLGAANAVGALAVYAWIVHAGRTQPPAEPVTPRPASRSGGREPDRRP